MASSNRHWPSMFKSKPTYTTTHQDHQWQSHGSNHIPTHRSSGRDERPPEPKPRWNPKPEQIGILESIFNSGLVNPPRDEIRRIRTQLQEYGQVGDANVFYWFQNRKSRNKHKNRHLQRPQNHQPQPMYGTGAGVVKVATTFTSSYAKKSSSNSNEFYFSSPTGSVNQQPQAYLGEGGGNSFHQHHGELFHESFIFPVVQEKPQETTTPSFLQGFCFPEIRTMIDQGKEVESTVNIVKMLSQSTPSPPPPQQALLAAPTKNTVPQIRNDLQGVDEAGARKTIVFINDVPFEVDIGPFNVKEAFGGDMVLVDSSGRTVVTDEWGLTLQSLQHGALYYLVCAFTDDHVDTVDMI